MPDEKQLSKRGNELGGVIKKYMAMRKRSRADVCGRTGMSVSTWHNRMNSPGDITVDELAEIKQYLRIPEKELVKVLQIKQ